MRWRKIKFFVTHWIPEEKRDETCTFKCHSTAAYFRKLTDDRLFGRKAFNKTKKEPIKLFSQTKNKINEL